VPGFLKKFLSSRGVHNSAFLKVVSNEKEGGGSRSWQMIGIGLSPRRSRFVCLIILLSSLILCIFVSFPVKQNE
jgi:hypothetical protein